ncbi:unnamed protein product [Ophioblennius macclurei]
MASFARCAPPSARAAAAASASSSSSSGSALVEDPRFQELVQRSRSFVNKILQSIPDTHRSCVYIETLQLNSSENAKLGRMAVTIRLPTAPVLKVVSENVTLEQSLKLMYEGLQLHRAALISVSHRLEHKERVTELLAEIRDLCFQISKMLKMAQAESGPQPTASSVDLHLPGKYEVQVAVHLTLVQLQSFSHDVVRCLRVLDQSDEEDYAES